MKAHAWRDDWRQFVRLGRGAGRRLLVNVTASEDADPVPFAIWATALALAPLLLSAIRSTLRLSMTGDAETDVIVGFIQVFRAFYVFYGMLLALLATAVIWDALLPDRADQEVVGVLPVRPMVLAAARLAGATRIILILAAAVAAPVALTFGAASGMQPGTGSLWRVVAAHLVTVLAAMMSVFWSLVTIRAVIVLIGRERTAERLASLLQAVTLLVFVEAFIFLPGVMGTVVRALRAEHTGPFWLAPTLWFSALYGWIAEGGARTTGVDHALLAAVLPVAAGIVLSLAPAAWLARRVHTSQARHRASAFTRLVRGLLAVRRPGSRVSGIVVFAAATLSRSRRHALLIASYTGMAIALGSIQLLTAGFEDGVNLTAPRRDLVAVPLVAIFFVVVGLRAALSRPADPLANWIFRLALPSLGDSRQAAMLLVLLMGVAPVLLVTAVTAIALWGVAVAVKVIAFDGAAALLLTQLAFARWTTIPCGSLHAAAIETVKSRGPLLVLFLYLFAFRGADLEMYALMRGNTMWVIIAFVLSGALVIRYQSERTGGPVLDVPSDGLSLLQLSGTDG